MVKLPIIQLVYLGTVQLPRPQSHLIIPTSTTPTIISSTVRQENGCLLIPIRIAGLVVLFPATAMSVEIWPPIAPEQLKIEEDATQVRLSYTVTHLSSLCSR